MLGRNPHFFVTGVYEDVLGTGNTIKYETVDGWKYCKNVDVGEPMGAAYPYNTGTLLSGGAGLYCVIGDSSYLVDARKLSYQSYSKFAFVIVIGGKQCYEYVYHSFLSPDGAVCYWDGVDYWFYDVYLRGWLDVYIFMDNEPDNGA